VARTKRILISGYYGFSNAGDEAVLSGIVSGLRRLGGEKLEITVLSASPEETSRMHRVHSIPRTSWRHLREALRVADLVISGGGSLIQDATSLRSLLYYLLVIWLAQRYHQRVMVLGQGIGPLKRRVSRRLSEVVLNKVDLITVRDPDSAEFLKRIGVRKPIQVTADPAFLLDTKDASGLASLPETWSGLFASSDVITLALREWSPRPLIARAAIEGLKRLDIPARLFLVAMHAPPDVELAQQICKEVNGCVAQTHMLSPRELIALVGASKMVVAMRLHALIFAGVCGIPMLGIAYDPKVRSFLDTVHQDCMSLEELEAGSLPERIKDTWNHREDLALRLSERVPALRTAAEQNVRLALELLEL